MALSVKNKNFLSHLHKLGIDINEFPDKTFDGLFDNMPDNSNCFFNWFLENITPANVLTKLEEAAYFELENNALLPTEEEMSHVLSTHKPTFEELNNLDVVNIKTTLPDNLKDLRKNHEHLLDYYRKLDFKNDEVLKMCKEGKEKLNIHKKQFEAVSGNCEKTVSLLIDKAREVESYLLNWPSQKVNDEIYENSSKENDVILNKLQNSNLMKYLPFHSNIMNSVPELEKNLVNVETLLVLSKGFLESAKAEMDALEQFHQNTSTDLNMGSPRKLFISPEKSDTASIMLRAREIKVQELDLLDKINKLSAIEMSDMVNTYYLEKAGINKRYIDKLQSTKTLVNLNETKNSWLHHVLSEVFDSLGKVQESRKDCLTKINKLEMMCYNNVINFKLKKKMYEEVGQRKSQISFLATLKEAATTDNKCLSLGNIMQLVNNLMNDPNDETQKIKTELQLTAQKFMNDVLCGPTSQIMNMPVDLVSSFQKCEELCEELSTKIKHLVNAYLETKDLIAKSDRRGHLMWINFLTNPKELESLVKNTSQSSE